MDFAGELPVTSSGNRHVLLLVETTTKWPELFALPDQKAQTVANVHYDHIFTRYGPPNSILTDRGQNFMSTVVSEVCKRFNVKRLLTSSYHAQTNSSAERFFSSLWQSLRTYCLTQKDWDKYLSTILYAHRATPSASSTQFSPAFLLYGREMKLALENALVPVKTGKITADAYIKELLPKLEIARDIAKSNIESAQQRYKAQYDKHQNPTTYEPGAFVWLHNPHTPKGDSPKLKRKYEGPYYVVQRTDKDTYILRHTMNNKLHPSPVHVNRLRPHLNERDMLFSWFEHLGLPTMEPSTGSLRDTESPETMVPDAHKATVADETTPIPGPDHQEQGPVPSTSMAPAATRDWYPVKKLMATKVVRKQRYFKLLWEDPNHPPTWESEVDVSDTLKRAFYVTHTRAGSRRKRKIP